MESAVFGDAPMMNDSNAGNTEETELNDVQKLQLAERANEIYRQQLKYMQDHLASLRSLIQDKENIIVCDNQTMSKHPYFAFYSGIY